MEQLEQHDLEFNKQEQEDMNAEIAWNAFKLDAIARITDVFKTNGDIVDMINTLDLEFDEVESLSNEQINELLRVAILDLWVEAV